MIFQIDPSIVRQITEEVVSNIPKPEPGMDTWIYGLLVLSGWAVAVSCMWFWYQDRKNLSEAMSETNNTMIATKVYLEGRAVQDQRIDDLRISISEIKAKIDNLLSRNNN